MISGNSGKFFSKKYRSQLSNCFYGYYLWQIYGQTLNFECPYKAFFKIQFDMLYFWKRRFQENPLSIIFELWTIKSVNIRQLMVNFWHYFLCIKMYVFFLKKRLLCDS